MALRKFIFRLRKLGLLVGREKEKERREAENKKKEERKKRRRRDPG